MSVRRLEGSPSSAVAYLKAGLGAVPGSGSLPFLPGGGGELPELELELPGAAIEPERLARYCRVCGFTLRDTVPATYPHVLAFPLHMALLTDPRFPFPAVGLVHIANRIVQRRPIRTTETLDLRVRATDLAPHPKGQTFTLVTEARAGGELVWEGESTNLRRGGGGEAPRERRDGGGNGDAPRERRGGGEGEGAELRVEAEWSLPGDLGRRYGAVSGDRNPIHLYGLSAKAFGFPRQIAHGMWTKARCVAALEPRLPDAVEVEVAFKRPILLPAKVEFLTSLGEPVEFAVRDKRKGTPHLAGKAGPAPA